jgi:hypothetical protein
VFAATGYKIAPFIVLTVILGGIVLYTWSRAVEVPGRRPTGA